MRKKTVMEIVADLKMVLYSAKYTISVPDLRELSEAIMRPISRSICAMQAIPGLLSHSNRPTLVPIEVMDEEQFETPSQRYKDGRFRVYIF